MKSSSLAPMTVHNQDWKVDFQFQKPRCFWISIVWVTSTVFPKEAIEFIIYQSWLAGDSGAPNNTEKYTSPSPKSRHSILTHSSFTVTLSSLNATAEIVDAWKSWTVDITWQKCTCKRRIQRCHSALFPKMLMAALELLLLKRLNGMVWSSMPCSKWSTGEKEKWRDLHHTFSSMRSQNVFTFLRSSQSH